MKKTSIFAVVCAVGILALLGGGPSVLPANAQDPAGTAMLLDARDTAGLAWLQAGGGVQLAEYGAFSLWEIPASAGLQHAVVPSRLRRVQTRIDLRGLPLDSALAQPEPLLSPTLQAEPAQTGVKRLWMVQFAGPPQDTWLDELRADGQSVAGCFQGSVCLLWGEPAPAGISRLGRLVRWQGEFHPAYRLHPDLRPGGNLAAAGTEVEVIIQLLDTPEAQAALGALRRLAVRLDETPHRVINLLNARARISVDRLNEAAALAPVVNIEPYRAPQKLDELQAQILAGNVSSGGIKQSLNYQEYLAWLNSAGLPTNPVDYPIVDVVDDGIDQGDAGMVLHPDFFELGDPANPDRIDYLQSCLVDQTTNGVAGHGNLNAGIVGGYNDEVGFPFADADGLLAGFRYGLGISPYGRLAGTKVFTDRGYWDVFRCGDSYSGLVQRIYTAGARISNNSWGDGDASGSYDAGAQEYDALTRDADPSTPGNQEMLHVFSAGNDGYTGSIGSPGTAKNVVTVGATGFPRDGGSAENLAWYSSRGPTDDLRAKPDLVAPGSAIAGPASMDALYDGSGVYLPKYYPPGQILYAHSYGTSHSTPAVSGAAQLVYADYAAAHSSTPPSAAMVKGLLINNTRYLNGFSTGGDLPSNTQGWGMPVLADAFERAQPLLVDQTIVFGGSGEAHSWNLNLGHLGKDLRVTLVWTDAPGSTVGPVLVNDLDLEVTAGGEVYSGNVFQGAYSTAGGFADEVNNIESVFLPFNSYNQVQIRVTAWNISGDGIPGNSDPTDQDFALIVSSRGGMVIYWPFVTN